MEIIPQRLIASFKHENSERNVIFLTCAGLLPFIILTLFLRLNWYRDATNFTLLINYAALILSFLGGIQWGAGLLQADKCALEFPYIFTISILPTLFGWLILAVHNIRWQLIGLIIAFSSVLIIDIILTCKKILPIWFLKLRIVITIVVVMLLIVNCYRSY